MTDCSIARENMLSHYGKSFAWAATVLPARQLQDARKVYAFCRYIDDIVDEHPNKIQAKQLLQDIQYAITRTASDDPIVADMIECQQRLEIPSVILIQLIEGVGKDLSLTQIENEEELLQYSYGVASTVGLLMCYVFGVRAKQAHRYAIDLGLAMQMTNIARDVVEDAKRGRIYLPKTWLEKPLSTEQIVQQPLDEKSDIALKHLLRLADRYYKSADAGLAYLPWRARMSIIIASRVYQAIGHKVKGLSTEAYWQAGRVYTTNFEKIKLSCSAIKDVILKRQYHQPILTQHQAHLHFRIEELLRDVC